MQESTFGAETTRAANWGNSSLPIVWDYIAIYPKGELWDESPPEPVYSHAPVIQGMAGAQATLKSQP